MINRTLIAIQMVYSLFFFGKDYLIVEAEQGDVLGVATNEEAREISYPSIDDELVLVTETAFAQKEVVEVETIDYETVLVDDEELEYGKEEVKTPGVLGTRTETYLVTHWLDDEIDRQLINTESVDPVSEIVSVGKKIIWHELSTPDLGKIDYWAKMTVFSTKYDSTCLGCNNTTALGAPVQEGVCAVDPKVIPMYTHFYVPGYGKCQALDVGGLIKGKRIDLAFRNAKTAAWGSGYVDIYLMDNEPTD